MITKEQFINLIEEYQKLNSDIDKASDALNLNIWESSCAEHAFKLFDQAVDILFTDNAIDIIDSYLYEDKPLSLTIGGKKYIIDTIEKLWDVVKDYGRK